MPKDQGTHMSSANFGEISSNSYDDTVFIQFIGSLLAVALTFGFFDQKI